MEYEKILIFRTEQIGDFIVTIPIFNEIRKRYPRAKLTIIIKKINYDLAKNLRIFNKIIIYEDILTQRNVSFYKLLINLNGMINLIKNILLLRKEKYDLAIDFSGRKYNWLRFKFIWANEKILANPDDIRKIDEIKRLFNVVKPIGIIMPKKLKFLNRDKNAEKKIKDIIKRYNLKEKIIITVHHLTPLIEKNWPLSNFIRLFRDFEKEKIIFILLGTTKEKEITNLYLGNCKNILNLMGKLSLIETYELIKQSDLFLGLDSGPLHIAKFTDTPLIAIFGNENLEYTRWGLKREIDKGFEKNNLEELKVEDVADYISQKLKKI